MVISVQVKSSKSEGKHRKSHSESKDIGLEFEYCVLKDEASRTRVIIIGFAALFLF